MTKSEKFVRTETSKNSILLSKFSKEKFS